MNWFYLFSLVILCNSFSLDEAEEYLLNAYASYCAPEPLMRWQCYWCNETNVNVTFIISNVTNDIFGFVGIDSSKSNIVVSFRGSKRTSIANWIENLDFYRVQPYIDLPNLLVHQGFWQAYLSIVDQLLPAVLKTAEFCPQCKNILYLGHSLGATIVAFAAVDLQYIHNITQPVPFVFTFGQPRIGNEDWANFYNIWVPQSVRIVHNRDPVPHLPLQSMGFYHAPREYWEYAERTLKQCSSDGEDITCSDSIIIPNLNDHFIYLGFDHRDGSPFNCK